MTLVAPHPEDEHRERVEGPDAQSVGVDLHGLLQATIPFMTRWVVTSPLTFAYPGADAGADLLVSDASGKVTVVEIKSHDRVDEAQRDVDSAVASYAKAAMRRADVSEIDTDVWFASVPGLQGAIGDGATRDEALAELQTAIESWVLLALDQGAAVPFVGDAA